VRGSSRLGLSLPLDGLSLPECVELAQFAEHLGYTDVWTSEINGADGFTLLAAIAARTRSIRLGLAVAPVYTRPPALLAMTAASLQSLSQGRFVLGLGSSTEPIVERWMGLTFRQPLTRVRETVEALRLALTGERVSFEGETLSLRDFRLQLGPADVPIVLAALGPRMLRLAGEIADGVVLSFAGLGAIPAQLGEVSAHLPAGFDVLQRVGVAIDEDEQRFRSAVRRELAGYARTQAYNASFARQGYAAEASAIQQAWQRGDARAAAEAVSDRLIADTYLFGTPEVCRDRLASYRQAGLRTPIVVPISLDPEPAQRLRQRRRVLEALA
jgi:probable F420-dependent oxidoreductase